MPLKPFTQKITHLDAEKDHQEIVRLLVCHVFHWDLERALEFALFRTFAVPSISTLLEKTGEFQQRPRKRYDDTELIMYELAENGYTSERAKRAFRRMNRMHGHWPITNDDMLYVLSTFIFEPIRWIDQYGWRKLAENERLAFYHFYVGVGGMMNIKDIPGSYEAFEAFNINYEKTHFKTADSNRKIGDVTVDLLLSFYIPKFLAPVGKPVVYAMMDDPLLESMGYPKPSAFLRSFVKGMLRFRAWLIQFWPEFQQPQLGTKRKRPTYPKGYEIEELGVHYDKEQPAEQS